MIYKNVSKNNYMMIQQIGIKLKKNTIHCQIFAKTKYFIEHIVRKKLIYTFRNKMTLKYNTHKSINK